jgi:tRNA A37 threonylcarbamoyladenosine modification protein TsaB
VLAVLDARRGEIAAALFRRDAAAHRLTDDLLITPASARNRLPWLDGPVRLAGDALERHALALVEALAPHAVTAPPEAWWPRPSVLARLAALRLRRGERDDPIGLIPRYAQRPVARVYPGQEPV